MKRKILTFFLIATILISMSFISALNLTEEEEKVNDAYLWLKAEIDGKTCETLSLEEKIFSLLSTGKCKSELISTMDSTNKCWPTSNCDLKFTALATLALENAGANTEDQEEWLLSKEKIPQNMEWYLQIETDEPSICSIYYDEHTYTVSIDEEKKVDGNAGKCFDISSNGYWLEISSAERADCYGEEFEISCNKGFQTNLLFKSVDSDTISVYEKTSSASAEGTTSEKVESFCFGTSTTCNYEGSLWTSLVLESLDYEIDKYLPYLISEEDKTENQRFMPEVFLYVLTGNPNYFTEILNAQKLDKYWLKSGNKFYDTSLALYPLRNENVEEKTNSKNWLLEIQDSDGSWESNIRDTAFLLFSIWPKAITGGGNPTTFPDCEDGGNYCIFRTQCNSVGGNIIGDRSGCSVGEICCDTPFVQETCAEKEGEICGENEYCSIDVVSAGDTGQCCLGTCLEITEQTTTECEENDGFCRTYGCGSSEREASYSCDSGKTCCIERNEPEPGNYWWIIVLSILIVITVLAIVFRDKLRRLFFRIKQNFGKGGGESNFPSLGGMPPRGPPSQGPYPRMPPQRRSLRNYDNSRQKPKLQSQHELDDVLTKLRDMSK